MGKEKWKVYSKHKLKVYANSTKEELHSMGYRVKITGKSGNWKVYRGRKLK